MEDRFIKQYQHYRGPMKRGTKEWDDREERRKEQGCVCLSFGSIENSIVTNGVSARRR